MKDLQADAEDLLNEIAKQERETPNFTLRMFIVQEVMNNNVIDVPEAQMPWTPAPESPKTKWWKFWN